MSFNTKIYILSIVFSLFTTSLFSQEIQAVWSLSKNKIPATTGAIKAAEQRLNNLTVSSYIFKNAQRTLPSDLNWPAEKTANKERYLEYAIVAENNIAIKIQAIKLFLSYNSDSRAKVDVVWSVNGTSFTPLLSNHSLESGSTPKEYEFADLDIIVPKSQTFYIRVYPWTTSGISSKYLISREVVIKGSEIKN